MKIYMLVQALSCATQNEKYLCCPVTLATGTSQEKMPMNFERTAIEVIY